MDVITNLEPTRKCWRLVGGVLVEKTVEDVQPTLKVNIDMVIL
jgi:prefoldin subunit 2